MSRILFIYARLNPTVVYVQGMNEVLATLYYCFWQSTVSHSEYFESDLFFTFTLVMSDLRDGFVRYMDSEETGINGKINKFSTMLQEIDPELKSCLDENNVQPNFYALRWLMLMMAQEFELLNVIKLWDSLIADSQRWNFVFYLCMANIEMRRDSLIDADFSDMMQALQRHSVYELNENEYIDKILHLAKTICIKHTRKYDYFIGKKHV
jgi:hypothetical protein